MTWYVLDTRTGEVVNAIEADRRPELKPGAWVDVEHLTVKAEADVPIETLRRYEYWDKRP